MDEQKYERYLQLINRRYRYDTSNVRRYGLVLKLMSWQYQASRYRKVEEVAN